MTHVRVLKSTGFEQAGQIVDWRGPTEEFVANGTIEILNVPGQEDIATEAVAPEETPEETPEEVEAPVETPVVEPEPEEPVVEPETPEVVEPTPVAAE